MGPGRTAVPPGGPTLPGPPPQKRRRRSGGRGGLAAGGAGLSEEVEGGVETLSEGRDVAHPPGSGAPVEGGASVPSGEEEGDGRPAESHRNLPAALL